MNILGIRYGHDAAAALIVNGKIVADVSEERFTRTKNDCSFPIKAIEYCLKQGGITSEDLDCVAFPNASAPDEFFKFFIVPEGMVSVRQPRSYLGRLKKILLDLYGAGKKEGLVLPLYQKRLPLSAKCRIHLAGHHLSHAASAYYTSGFTHEKTLVFTLDGVGEGVSVAVWRGEGNKLKLLKQYGPEASLGWFYSNCTEGLGWRHGSDEWKTMGLAPYGTPVSGALTGFHPEFAEGELVTPHNYGKFGRWNDHGANHYHGKDSVKLSSVVAKLGRENFAAETQRVAEEEALHIILPWIKREKVRKICCAGGFFLNVKFNQRLWYTGELDAQWIYPNPGDSGLPVGSALHAFYSVHPDVTPQKFNDVYSGPEFSSSQIQTILEDRGIAYSVADNPSLIAAKFLAQGKIIAWFQGRMEAGPRALGNRSILMSPLKAGNKDIINARIKYREPFRPFCPSMMYEKATDYLINLRDERFMITTFDVKPEKRDKIPAVVHADGTSRPHMVLRDTNPRYYDLIKAFGDITGEYVVLNTSFNIKGEPIVCNPREALKCFYDTGLDVLIMDKYVVEKTAPFKRTAAGQ